MSQGYNPYRDPDGKFASGPGGGGGGGKGSFAKADRAAMKLGKAQKALERLQNSQKFTMKQFDRAVDVVRKAERDYNKSTRGFRS